MINATTNNKVKDITVGNDPNEIIFNHFSNAMYVVNELDDSISVIDPTTNQVLGAKVMFNVEPFNSGHIECQKENSIAPLTKQFYLYDGDKCVAKPSQGFEFVSWQQNLKGNSTQLLQIASTPSILDSVMDFFHIKKDKPEATLPITKFGTFTATFKSLPPPIPTEYVATLFTIVITAFVGSWLTPTIIEWRKTKNQVRKLRYYYYQLNSLYDDGKLDEKDIDKLNDLRNTVTDDYTMGRINKEQFDKLVNETEISYMQIFKNEINSLFGSSKEYKERKLKEIENDIKEAYNNGKINNEQYTNLKKEISIKYGEI